MFITGPKVVRAVTFEEVTAEDLGGVGVHNHKSGVAHFASYTEEECLQTVRELLSYLPVSYTHLDVYKRQGYSYPKCR